MGRNMRTCGEVMTSNVTVCEPNTSVEEAARIMKMENIGPIPVVDNKSNRQLVGIVTDRDLVLNVLAEGRDASSTQVGDVMTRQPITCGEHDDLDKAMKAMQEHQIRRIPVVDAGNHIIGIIAQADIATRTADDRKKGEVVEQISKPTDTQVNG
jgi:CBS domain-containing protein